MLITGLQKTFYFIHGTATGFMRHGCHIIWIGAWQQWLQRELFSQWIPLLPFCRNNSDLAFLWTGLY